MQLTKSTIDVCATRAAEALRAQGVVLYPTDTVYGLGADALSDGAVAKVRTIKGRQVQKPIHAIVSDLTMAEEYAEVNDRARLLAKEFWPGALTLILKKKPNVASGIGKGMETIGIRIPAHPFCLALAREFGGPITTTSANKSAAASPRRVDDILDQLGESALQIDLVVDAGELPNREPSTVVDVHSGELKILREGTIPVSEIRRFISSL